MENFEYLDETMCDDVSSSEEKYWNNLAYEQSKESSSTFDSFQSALINVMSADAEDHSIEQNSSNVVPKRRGRREKKQVNLDLPYELQQSYRILNDLMSDSNKAVNWPFIDPLHLEKNKSNLNGIKEPIWFNKIKQKLDNGEYPSITQLVSDIRLLLQNCFRTFESNHSIFKRGLKLETMLEQKLALLPRELRDKTSIAATSGIPDEDSVSPYTSRRRIRYSHSVNSSQLLTQLRQEHLEQEREHRKHQVQERKAANEAFYQEVLEWEDKMFLEPLKSYVLDMWELPQIGLFLYLAQAALNLPEISQFELERIFLIPRESNAMHSMMTSLLSTPYQRTKLDKKPEMPYKVWHEKLKAKVNYWYKILHDKGRDSYEAAIHLGLDINFFNICGKNNPLENKAFHELTFNQKIWLVKSLCDISCEKEASVQEAINAQPLPDQRAYILGWDSQDNTYLHFPQFCGADLRIYKQGHLPGLKIPKERERKKEFFITRKRKQSKRSLKNSEASAKSNPVLKTSPEPVEEEEQEPEREQFSLIVDSVESLRHLIEEFEDKQIKKRKIREGTQQNCEKKLLNTFINILTELEPWETKLIQANKRTRLKLKKEWDDFQKKPPEEAPKEENVWDSEEEKICDSDELTCDKEMDSLNSNSSLEENKLSYFKPSLYTPNKSKTLLARDLYSQKEENSELLDISSRGRIRKARKIPNNVEDTKPKRLFKIRKVHFADEKTTSLNTSTGLHILSQAALSNSHTNIFGKNSSHILTNKGAYKVTSVPTTSTSTSTYSQNISKKKKLCYNKYSEDPPSFKNKLISSPTVNSLSGTTSKVPAGSQTTTPQQAQVIAHFQKQGFRVEAGPDGKVLVYITQSSQLQQQLALNGLPASTVVTSSSMLSNLDNLLGLKTTASDMSPTKSNSVLGFQSGVPLSGKAVVLTNPPKPAVALNSLSGVSSSAATITQQSLSISQVSASSTSQLQTSNCILTGSNLLTTPNVTFSNSSTVRTSSSLPSFIMKGNNISSTQLINSPKLPLNTNFLGLNTSVSSNSSSLRNHSSQISTASQSGQKPSLSPCFKEIGNNYFSQSANLSNSAKSNNLQSEQNFILTGSGNSSLGLQSSNLPNSLIQSNSTVKPTNLSLAHSVSSNNLILGSNSSFVSAPSRGSGFSLQSSPVNLQTQSKPKYANNITVKSLLESNSTDKQKSNLSSNNQNLSYNEKLILESQVQNKPKSIPFSTAQGTSNQGVGSFSKTNYVPTTILNIVPTSVIVSGISTPLLNTNARISSSTASTTDALSTSVITMHDKLTTSLTPLTTQKSMVFKVLSQGVNPQTLIIHQNSNQSKNIIGGQNVQAISKDSIITSQNQYPVISSSNNPNAINNILRQQTFVVHGQNIFSTLVQPSTSSAQLPVTSPTKNILAVQQPSQVTPAHFGSELNKGIFSSAASFPNTSQQSSQPSKNNLKFSSEPPPLQNIFARSISQPKLSNSGSSNILKTSCAVTSLCGSHNNDLQKGNFQSISSSPNNPLNIRNPIATETIPKTHGLIFNQNPVHNLSTNTALLQQNSKNSSQLISNNGREVTPSSNHNISTTIPTNVHLQIPSDSHNVFLLNIDGRSVTTDGIPVALNNMGQHILLSGRTPLKPSLPTGLIPSRYIVTNPVLLQGQQNKVPLSNGTLPGKIVNSGLIGQPPVLHLSQSSVLVNNQFQLSATTNQKSSLTEQ